MPAESAKQNYAAPNRKIWVYGILLLIILASLAYYALMNRKERSVNHDYYRVLYEASNTFKENLNKLDSMHRYREGVSSIRSLLPSYSGKPLPKKTDEVSFVYTIEAESIKVSSEDLSDFSAQLTMHDILPEPKKGFSQYLFADSSGKVLARTGAERTISVVQLSSINEQIQRKNKQFQLNFSDPEELKSSGEASPLPSYSNHVDMKISYGEFRVFVFPFSLDTPLQQSDTENSTLNKLYLVGLLPQDKLASRDSGGWNLSLLIVTLISLVFMWCMLRLYLLPKNQSITRGYRLLTTASSYLFYIVLIALILAYFQKSLLQAEKDKTALRYAQFLEQKLSADIQSAFTQLAGYRDFYLQLLNALNAIDVPELYTDYSAAEIQRFNQNIAGALTKLPGPTCDQQGELYSWIPRYAGTAFNTYAFEYPCPSDKQLLPSKVEPQVNIDPHGVSVMVNAYRQNDKNKFMLAFYSNNQLIDLDPERFLETSIAAGYVQPQSHTLLSVFGLSKEGNSVLPSVSFQESNTLPTTFNLSHRDYYKKVRDHKGWDLSFTATPESNTAQTFNNVYIQRLLNVNNGTRGTTISMPISQRGTEGKALDYIIGADVMLPSMTLGQSPPFDFVYMVVERASGKVLFHNDSERSLVENLYYTGDKRSPLSKWLKASLDHYSQLASGLITGTYHGQDGRFAVSSSPVEEWAIVVFYPNDSLQSYMTNQFLYVATTFALILSLMVTIIYLVRHFVWTSSLKEKLNLPAKLNVRLVMLVSSALFSAGYSLYILGFSLDRFVFADEQINGSLWLHVVGLSLATLFIYRGCYNHFCYPQDSNNAQTRARAQVGSRRLIAVVLATIAVHFVYLQNTADAPQKSLDFHYQQLSCNWLNYERQELITIGLSRYPNSITSSRIAPMDLLPLAPSWRQRLREGSAQCQQHAPQVHPDEYPSLSSVFGATYLWQWIYIYLLNNELTASYTPQAEFAAFLQQFPTAVSDVIVAVLGYALLISALIFLWFRFNTSLLWNRLYCPERFLQHIQRMTRSVHGLQFEERHKNLCIECDTVKLNGVGLALLLRTLAFDQQTSTKNLLLGFDQLFGLSPSLQRFSQENTFLPNLKINLKNYQPGQPLNVEIWDIETCLEKSQFRQSLLDLIMELKSLTLSGQLGSFTIFTGFHSLHRVKMKDPLMLDQSALLDHAEYLTWADCLMDFIVIVPESFKQGVDWKLLSDEVNAFPELQFLRQEVTEQHQQDDWSEVWKRDQDRHLESRWATINYILLNAEALYRFKWESCSSAEKLALLNLAKQQKLNPANTQMIEHLALNGLITVRKGSLDIVNKSFAHFVLHAETAATLNQLVQHGEAGVWKNYKLPLGILILLIIGGIALTSGESIYIIAASVAGVLGTIASVTNSANLLRGQAKD